MHWLAYCLYRKVGIVNIIAVAVIDRAGLLVLFESSSHFKWAGCALVITPIIAMHYARHNAAEA